MYFTIPLLYPLKRRKIFDILMFSGGIEMERWAKMD